MITKLYEAVRQHVYFGSKLAFHPTSEAVEAVAKKLPGSVAIATTRADLREDRLSAAQHRRRDRSAALRTGGGARDDLRRLSATSSCSTRRPTTSRWWPASSRRSSRRRSRTSTCWRGTAARRTWACATPSTTPTLRALDGKWVRLVVGSFEYSITEVTADEADAWWEAHKPPPRQVPAMDLTVTDLRDIEYVVLEDADRADAHVDPERDHRVRRQGRRLLGPPEHATACRSARRSRSRSSTTTSS